MDHYLDPSHSDYVGDDLANNFFIIRYHYGSTGWGDPMYHAIGPPEFASDCDEDPVCYRLGGTQSSNTTYSPPFLPTLYVDGEISPTGTYHTDATATRNEETSVSMSLEGTTFDSTLTANIKLAINSNIDLSGDDLRLFVAITMDSIHYNGTNGETEHHGVFLGWANKSFGGDTLDLAKDDTVKKSYEWTLREDYPKNSYFPKNDSEMDQVTWDKKNMNVIAFVQKTSDNDVLQVTHLSLNDVSTLSIAQEQLQPSGFALNQNYPNPFNSGTLISYRLPHSSDVEVVVHTILGQPVKTLVAGSQNGGMHTVRWDGKDGTGKNVSGGIYLYRITAGQFTAVRKMIYLK